MLGGLPHGRDLRMGQRVAIDLAGVPPLARDMSLGVQHHGPHGHIAVLRRTHRQIQRATHRLVIVHTRQSTRARPDTTLPCPPAYSPQRSPACRMAQDV